MSDIAAAQNGDAPPDSIPNGAPDLATDHISDRTTGPSTGREGWSLEEAAARLAALDAAAEESGRRRVRHGEQEQSDIDQNPDDMALESDGFLPAPESETDSASESDALNSAPESDELESVSESDTGLHTVSIDGADQEVSLGELKAGYQRQADYTRKTQTLAEERRQLQSERGQYQQMLGTISQTIAAGPYTPPDQSLLDADPAEYIRQSQQWQARQQVAGAAAREQERVRAQIEQEETASTVEQNLQQDYLLARSVPGWSDPTARQIGKAEIGDYLVRAYGATQDELNEFTDHRLVVLAHKALQYDKLMSKRNLAQKKVRSVPQVQAPGAARSKQEVDAATVMALRDQFHKSGSIDDAAKLMRYLGG